MSDIDHASAETHFARAQLLRSQHRITDAIASYKQVLQLNPNHAPSYIMLAICWIHEDGSEHQALDAAQKAVALEPEDAFAHSVLALAKNAVAKTGQTAQVRDALQQARHAVGLDPDSDFAHAVTANLHLRLHEFAEAEQAARKALELDIENTMASEVLSVALLRQRKDGDNKDLIDYQLQNNPDDDSAHTSAGWQALMEGDHRRANQHFMEALRLSPMNESARMGLVESFRARSFLYRLQVRFSHFMNQFTEGRQTMIMIGGFFAYKVLSGLTKNISPILFSIIVGAWMIFALWSHLARGFSSFFIAMDRFARQSLRPREYWEGITVGGLLFTALACVILGYAFGLADSGFAGMACLMAAVVNAAAFTNDHHLGQYVYGLAGAIAGAAAAYVVVDLFSMSSLPKTEVIGLVAIFSGVATTWLRSLRVLYA